MKLAIIGRGSVAQALARALSGHEISFGVRDPNGPSERDLAAAAAWGEAIILATPWGAESEVAAAIEPHIAGKPVIDATNPVGMTEHGPDLVTTLGRSAAEGLQARLPEARVVKTFNQIGAEFMAEPGRLDRPAVMFVASDDSSARNLAVRLVREAGFEAVDAGPLSNARHLESLAMLWIWSALKGDLGRSFGFALARQKG